MFTLRWLVFVGIIISAPLIHVKPPAAASLYDPVFTEEDMKGFESLGLYAVAGEEALVCGPVYQWRLYSPMMSKNATHIFSRPTLVIMPHCDVGLYNQLLESNWSRQSLSMIVVLGNPLDQYLLTLVLCSGLNMRVDPSLTPYTAFLKSV